VREQETRHTLAAPAVQIEQTSEARSEEKPSETGRGGLPHPLPRWRLVISEQGANPVIW